MRRLLAAFLAGTFANSGCVTTVTVSPASVAAAAGLPEGEAGELHGTEGSVRVDGSTWVTLHSSDEGTETVNEVALSKLRHEGGILLIPGDGHRLSLRKISDAQITKLELSVAPSSLVAVAGLPEDQIAWLSDTQEASPPKDGGVAHEVWLPAGQQVADPGAPQAEFPAGASLRVSGATRVTLRSVEDGARTANELRLSNLRTDGEALILPGNSHAVPLNDIWSAEVVQPSPGKTAGLVAAIVLGTGVVGVALYYVIGELLLQSALNNLFR